MILKDIKINPFFSALALEGGAHDSGRAWSSQGLLVAVHTWSSAAMSSPEKSLPILNNK